MASTSWELHLLLGFDIDVEPPTSAMTVFYCTMRGGIIYLKPYLTCLVEGVVMSVIKV